jgi:hypothetical protein
MRREGRKVMAAVGVFFTAGVLLVAAGLGWGFLDRHAWFVPSVQAARCADNRKTLESAKADYAQERELANGAPVEFEQVVIYVPTGQKSLRCPAGGSYSIGAVGDPVRCSLPEHQRVP